MLTQNKHLLNIAKVVSNLYKDKEIKTLIFDEVSRKSVNGFETEILVKDILAKINLEKTAENSKKMTLLTESLEAFHDLDGRNWDPKVYIPNFQKQNNNFRLNLSRTTYNPDKPVFVIAVEDVEDPVGYQEIDDELVELNERVTEADANLMIDEGNDILVISLDENRPAYDDVGGGSDSSSGATTTNSVRFVVLEKMIVKHHKESWVSGKSEVTIRGFWDRAAFDYGNYFTHHNDDAYGTRIKKVSRSSIRNQTEMTVNFKILWDLNNVESLGIENQFYGYVIFECDSWPAPKKTITLQELYNGDMRTVDVRSWQSPYNNDYIRLIHNTSYDYGFDYITSHHVNNNGIEHNFTKTY